MALKDSLGSIMRLEKLLIGSALILFLITIALAFGQELDSDGVGQKLNLDIYLYETGKTLVAGYVEDPRSLTFLKPTLYTTVYAPQYISNYRYENDTRQLYAWTDALTMKRGETWSLIFSSRGFYDEYHTVFHLPDDLRLGRINISKGLNYLVSASNDSFAVEVQGYGVRDPAISVEYQQPMVIEDNNGNNSSGASSNTTGFSTAYLLLILALIAVGGLAFLMARRKDTSLTSESPVPEAMKLDGASSLSGAAVPEIEEKASPCEDQPHEASTPEAGLSEDSSEEEVGFDELPSSTPQPECLKSEIVVSSEMKAVMDALTSRERPIIEALIKHGGRMTQAEIRYETDMPRSSLTMILISLERRKLVTKKEWGRTNVVELSECFLSEK